MKAGKLLLAGIFAAAMATAETGPFGGENVLANGSFETGSSISSGVAYGATTSGWTLGANAGLTCPGSWCSPTWMHFPDGTRSAFIQMSFAGSWITQTFTAPKAGTYRLSFYHAARPGTVLGERVRVLVDGTDYGYATNWSMDFDFSTFDIPLSAGTHTLKLVGDQTGTSGDTTAVLDKFSLEIPSDEGLTVANINDYGFRFDLSTGAPVISGSRYNNDQATTFTATDGPNGSSTAGKFIGGWGSMAGGEQTMSGDWSIAVSCIPMSGSKAAIVCVGANGTKDRKQLLICSETDGRMYFAIGQNYGSGKNVPSAITVGGLVEPDTLFHSVCCVHRKASNYISCYIDGMLVGRLNAINACAGRVFGSGFQFNGCHGGSVSGINGGGNVPVEDVRFFERALSDADVALYARTYSARRPSQSPVATDVKPTEDTTYETDPTASGTLFVPAGVTVTAPALAGNYFNYGTIVLTGDAAVTASPRGPGLTRFTGTQSLNYTSYGNVPVEIAGDVTLQGAISTYRSSPLTITSGTVTLGGQVNLGDLVDSDLYDPLGSVVNFIGGTLTGEGFFYTGGRATQNDINITSGMFTARVAPWGVATSTGANRRVNVGGTGVFAPTSLVYQGGADPDSVQRTTINLREGGTFTPPADWPAYAWLDVQYGKSTLALAADVSSGANVEVESAATLTVDAGGTARTLDWSTATFAGAGQTVVTNGAAVKFAVGAQMTGALTVAADAKLQIDFATYAGDPILFTAASGLTVDGAVEELVELVDAPAGYHPALGDDGATIVAKVDDLTVVVLADWTGGGAAGKLDDPDNWTCYNAVGDVLSGRIPGPQTTVRVKDATNFQLPYDAAATLAAMDACTNDTRAATICAHIKYGSRGDMADFSFAEIPYANYDPLGETPLTLLADSTWKGRYLVTSQLRFDGWFKVTEEQAGAWTLGQSFDDYYAMYFDGVCVVQNKTYSQAASGTCTMTAGWHRFTLIVGDTYGGYGLTRSAGGTPTVLGVSINGADEVPFETAFEQGSGTLQNWKELKVMSCQLSTDADWSDVASFADGAVIDLAGHHLTVSELVGAAEITDTVGGGELIVTADYFNNTEVALTGQLRLVKAGAGAFYASKAGQSYTGGTEVQAGTFYFNTGTTPCGVKNSEIKIRAGATLNMNGFVTCYNYDTAGTIRMVAAGPGYNAAYKCFGPEFKLSGDAKITGNGFYFANPDGLLYFTMNDHTLTIEFDSNSYVGIGAWRARNAGRMLFSRGLVEWLAGYGPIGVDIEVEPSAQFKLGANFDMQGFWYKSSAWCKNNGVQAHMLVYGVWTATAFRPPVCLFNNSTIDLNQLTEPLDIAGGDRTCASGVNGYVNFSMGDGGTCYIDISKRGPFSAQGTKVITWTAAPSATTFEPTADTKKRHYSLVARSDGLYVVGSGFAILLR